MYFFKRIKIHCLMLRYKSSKLDFILLNKPKSVDNLPVKLNGQYIWFFFKNTKFEVIIWTFCYWKKALYFVKSQQWASMNQNGSAAVPNFGRGFRTDPVDNWAVKSSNFVPLSFWISCKWNVYCIGIFFALLLVYFWIIITYQSIQICLQYIFES